MIALLTVREGAMAHLIYFNWELELPQSSMSQADAVAVFLESISLLETYVLDGMHM